MALVFHVINTLRFDTDAGSDITYEVDILRSYDNTEPIPGWASESATDLIGTGNPVVLRYERDYEIYKPIQGSSVDLNLVTTEHGQYLDFADGTPYEFQLRIRRDDGTDMHDVWCGFFNPVETTEEISDFPFQLSFTAVDGLGLLEQASPEAVFTDSQVSIFQDVIVPALAQTGLELDIYVDSGIRNGANDALVSATSSSFAVWSDLEEDGTLFTYKQLLEGWLAAFNCHITQANGRWYIYNASTLADTTIWNTFDHEGTAGTSVTESLVLNIDGTSTQDLVPAFNDLQITLRRPHGSVECRPQDLVVRQAAANGTFDSADGWTIQHSATTISNGVARIGRNVFNYDTLRGSQAFRNTTGFSVSPAADIELEWDWRATDIEFDGIRTYYQFYVEFDAVSDVESLTLPTGYNVAAYQSMYNSQYQNYNYIQTTPSLRTLWWDDETSQWTVSRPRRLLSAETDSTNSWDRISHTLRAPATFYTEFQRANIENVRVFIQWYSNRGLVNRNRMYAGAETNRNVVEIDNLSVKSVFDDSIESPVFERVQENYNSTLTYEPLFASSIDSEFYQKINPTEFLERGELVTTNTKTLEELGTQFKLNDFRGQFKYYEGTLINLNEAPMSAINKIMLNWENYDGTNDYTETASGIINGGNWSLKKNEFETAFYIPNQSGDIASGDYDEATGVGYSTENVDLIPMKFPGRSSKSSYTLAYRVSSEDTTGTEVLNGLVPEKPFFQIIGDPGEIVETTITFRHLTGYIAVPASTSITADSTDTPTPEWAEFGAFAYVDGNLILPMTITIPEESEFEELFIDAVVDEFTPEDAPGIVASSIVFTHAIGNVNTPTTTTIPVNGVPGDRKQVVYTIEAATGRIMQNVDETHADTSLSNGVTTGNGTKTATITFDYEVPTTTESVAVTVTGSTTPEAAPGINILTRNLVITNSASNTTVVDGLTVPFTGLVGDVVVRNITVDPDDDRFISALSATTTTSSVVSIGTAYESGEDWEIPVTFSILADDMGTAQHGDMTIAGTILMEPYSLRFNINNIGVNQATIDTATHFITYDQGDFGDSITSFTFTTTAAEGRMFNSADDISVDVNEAGAVVENNVRRPLPESQFTASSVLNADNTITTTIAGNFPNDGGLYTLNINVLTDTPGETPATSGSNMTPRTVTIDNRAQTVFGTIAANGTWSVEEMDDWLTIVNTDNEGSRGGGVTILAQANTGTTQRIGTVRLNDGQTPATVLGGMTITQTADNNVMSTGISNIVTSSTAPTSGTPNTTLTIVTS